MLRADDERCCDDLQAVVRRESRRSDGGGVVRRAQRSWFLKESGIFLWCEEINVRSLTTGRTRPESDGLAQLNRAVPDPGDRGSGSPRGRSARPKKNNWGSRHGTSSPNSKVVPRPTRIWPIQGPARTPYGGTVGDALSLVMASRSGRAGWRDAALARWEVPIGTFRQRQGLSESTLESVDCELFLPVSISSGYVGLKLLAELKGMV